MEWTQLTGKILHGSIHLLAGEEEVISLLHTKVYVFSDSVLCLGKMNENPQSKSCMGRQIDVIQKFTRIHSFGHN